MGALLMRAAKVGGLMLLTGACTVAAVMAGDSAANLVRGGKPDAQRASAEMMDPEREAQELRQEAGQQPG